MSGSGRSGSNRRSRSQDAGGRSSRTTRSASRLSTSVSNDGQRSAAIDVNDDQNAEGEEEQQQEVAQIQSSQAEDGEDEQQQEQSNNQTGPSHSVEGGMSNMLQNPSQQSAAAGLTEVNLQQTTTVPPVTNSLPTQGPLGSLFGTPVQLVSGSAARTSPDQERRGRRTGTQVTTATAACAAARRPPYTEVVDGKLFMEIFDNGPLVEITGTPTNIRLQVPVGSNDSSTSPALTDAVYERAQAVLIVHLRRQQERRVQQFAQQQAQRVTQMYRTRAGLQAPLNNEDNRNQLQNMGASRREYFTPPTVAAGNDTITRNNLLTFGNFPPFNTNEQGPNQSLTQSSTFQQSRGASQLPASQVSGVPRTNAAIRSVEGSTGRIGTHQLVLYRDPAGSPPGEMQRDVEIARGRAPRSGPPSSRLFDLHIRDANATADTLYRTATPTQQARMDAEYPQGSDISHVYRQAEQHAKRSVRPTPFSDPDLERKRLQKRYPHGKYGYMSYYYWPTSYQHEMDTLQTFKEADKWYNDDSNYAISANEQYILDNNQSEYIRVEGVFEHIEARYMSFWKVDHLPPFTVDRVLAGLSPSPEPSHSNIITTAAAANMNSEVEAALGGRASNLSQATLRDLMEGAIREWSNMSTDIQQNPVSYARAADQAVADWTSSQRNSATRLSVAEERRLAQVLGNTAAIRSRGSTPYAQALLDRFRNDPTTINAAAKAGYMINVPPMASAQQFVATNPNQNETDEDNPLGEEIDDHENDDEQDNYELSGSPPLISSPDERIQREQADRSGYEADAGFVVSNRVHSNELLRSPQMNYAAASPHLSNQYSGRVRARAASPNPPGFDSFQNQLFSMYSNRDNSTQAAGQAATRQDTEEEKRRKKKPRTTLDITGKYTTYSPRPPGPPSGGAGAGRFTLGNRLIRVEYFSKDSHQRLDAPVVSDHELPTMRVNMVREDDHGLSGHRPSMPLYTHHGALSAKDWVSRFMEFAQITRIRPDTLAATFKFYQAEPAGRTACDIPRLAGEDNLSYFSRMVKRFLLTFGQSEMERRLAQSELLEIRKTPDESIDTYLRRYQNAWIRVNDGDGSIPFTNQDFTILLHSLGDGLRSKTVNWVWSNNPSAVTEPGSLLITNWAQLTSLLRNAYHSRSRLEKLDNVYEEMRVMEARSATGNGNSPSLLNIDKDKHSKDRFSTENPELRRETKDLWNKVKKNGGTTLTHLITGAAAASDNVNVNNPSHKPKKGKQNQKRKQQSDSTTSTTPAQSNKKKVRFAAQTPKGSNKKKFGPCPDCALPHDWNYCPRNREGQRFKPDAEQYKGTGASPHSTPEARKQTGLKLMETKSDSDTSDSSNSDSSSGSSEDAKPDMKNRRITIGPSGEKEVNVDGYLNQFEIKNMLIDTGAQVSLIDGDFYRTHQSRLGRLGAKPMHHVALANGERAKVLGTFSAAISIRSDENTTEKRTHHRFTVVEDLSCPIILGLDLCGKLFESLNFQTGNLRFRDQLTHARSVQIKGPSDVPLRVVKAAIIPPNSMQVVSVHYDQRQFKKNQVVSCESVPLFDKEGEELSIQFPPHIHRSSTNNGYGLLMANPSPYVLTLRAGIHIGRVIPFDSQAIQDAPEGRYRMKTDGELESFPTMNVRSAKSSMENAPIADAVVSSAPVGSSL